MKKFFIIIFFILAAFVAVGQNTKQKNYYKSIEPIENSTCKIEITNLVSKYNYSKFKLTVYNKNSDYIYVNPMQIKIKIGEKYFSPQKKILKNSNMIIPYKDSRSQTIEVNGENGFNVDNFVINLNGIYKFSSDAQVQEAPDLALPASQNRFEAGECFVCNLIKVIKQTDKTSVKFKCQYKSTSPKEKLGIITPAKARIKTENGEKFVSTKTNSKDVVLKDGQTITFNLVFKVPTYVVDMQFAKMDIVWENTFQETEIKKIKVEEIDIIKNN